MYSPICIYSPHHISTAMNEALTQTAPTAVRQSEPKPFTTCLLHNAEKKSFLGLHRAEPSGRTGSVFRLQEHRELQREKERWVAFLRNLGSSVILPSVLHVVSSSFYTMFAKLSPAKLVLLLFLRLLLCFDEHSETVVGLMMMEVGALVRSVMFNWNDQHQLRRHYVSMTAVIQA